MSVVSSTLDSIESQTPPQTPSNPPRFAALRHRDFRLFWSGNLVSLIGTLAQQTALGWLMRTLTPNPFLISVVAACGSAPILLFTLPAGVVADRVDKRRALILLNFLAAILALLLAALVFFQVAQIWHIALISVGVGIINAFDIPIRQSFNVEMVGRDDLPNAIALNSSAFNGARVAGPMVGGLLLRWVSMSGCFFINALSFFALIFQLGRMETPRRESKPTPLKWNEMRDGFVWVNNHATLRLVTILVAAVSLLAMSFGTLLPVFAKDVWRGDEGTFSFLMTCNGLGALGAAVSLAIAGKMRHAGKRLLLGAALFCACVVAFAASPSALVGGVFLILAGWFLLTFLMTANTLVQTLAPDELRGRVFSLYSLALIGTSPLGSLLIGALAHRMGTPQAVQVGAGLALIFVLATWLRFRRLWKEK